MNNADGSWQAGLDTGYRNLETEEMTDDELIKGFEAASLPAFPHADHVRLTIVYLARHGREETRRGCSKAFAVSPWRKVFRRSFTSR